MAERDTVLAAIERVFDAQRALLALQEELLELPRESLIEALVAAKDAALNASVDEAALRLERVAFLLGELAGPRVVDALIDVLDCPFDEAQQAARRELEALAFDAFDDVVEGVGRALERLLIGSRALRELPFVLGEVPRREVLSVLGRFLSHADAAAVTAAIEVLIERGEAGAVELVRPLVDDRRTLRLMGADTSVGELAAEAVKLLGSAAGDADGAESAREQS